MTKDAKRKRVEEESSDEGSQDESGSEETCGLDEAALHTLWDVENIKEILRDITREPGLTVFAAIRSKWGKGFKIKEAVDAHIEGMYESGYAEPTWDDGIFGMLRETRNLAQKLLEAAEFDAAFFSAHAVAAMIRKCEKSEAEDEPEEVEKWAKALDVLMVGAVKGWRSKSGNGVEQKKDAAAMRKLLDEGEHEPGCDQAKWYPETLKALKAWAK